MKYQPLFQISVSHPYYEGGRCPDLRLVSSAESASLLRRHRAVVKERPDGVLVLVPVGDGGLPLLPFPAGAALTFELRAAGEDVHLVTAPAMMPAMALEIPALSALVPSATPVTYPVAFAARPARWVYYVVTDVPEGAGTGVLTIVDTGASPLVFGEANTRDLVAAPDESDRVARSLAARYPDRRRLRFVSDVAIPVSEQVRRHIELRVDGSMVQEHLPNPSIRAYGRIGVGAPAVEEDTFHEVIEQLTQHTVMSAA